MSASFAIKRIEFSADCLKVFEKEIEQFGHTETGGVLLGHVLDGTAYVTKVIDSGPNAVHEDIYFRADKNYIDMSIDMEHANSNGKVQYLGEWHTHPQRRPQPSPLDLQSLVEIADSAEKFTIMVIVGAVGYTSNRFLNNSIGLVSYTGTNKVAVIEIHVR